MEIRLHTGSLSKAEQLELVDGLATYPEVQEVVPPQNAEFGVGPDEIEAVVLVVVLFRAAAGWLSFLSRIARETVERFGKPVLIDLSGEKVVFQVIDDVPLLGRGLMFVKDRDGNIG